MAKVKAADSKLKPGKPIAPKAVQSKAKSSNTVTAVRNGIERTFARQIWDNLPDDKAGFQEVANAPSLPKAKEKSPTPATYEVVVKAYTEAFGEAPGQDLSIDQINEAIEKKEADNA